MAETNSLAIWMNEDSVRQNIESVVGKNINQFVASVVALAGSNPQLAMCDRKSLLNACITATALHLPLSLGYAYVIPYKNNGQLVAQFQMGYRGLIQMALRSKSILRLNASDVREGEYKGIDRLTGDIKLEWADDEVRNNLPVIGYIAYVRLNSGFEKAVYMTIDEINKHAQRYSRSYNSTGSMNVWRDDFHEMASKTVLKKLLVRYVPMESELARAIEVDQSVIYDDHVEYIDNQPVSAEDVAAEKETERIKKFISAAKTTSELEKVADYLNDETRPLYDAKLDSLI